MPYIDFNYYTKEFCGTNVMEDEFPSLERMACDVIDSIVSFPIDTGALPPECVELVKKATAYQVETLFMQGGVDAIVGMAAQSADTEQLADYRISKGSTATSSKVIIPSIGGVPVSQMALSMLRRAGLMTRWAYAKPPEKCSQ